MTNKSGREMLTHIFPIAIFITARLSFTLYPFNHSFAHVIKCIAQCVTHACVCMCSEKREILIKREQIRSNLFAKLHARNNDDNKEVYFLCDPEKYRDGITTVKSFISAHIW